MRSWTGRGRERNALWPVKLSSAVWLPGAPCRSRMMYKPACASSAKLYVLRGEGEREHTCSFGPSCDTAKVLERAGEKVLAVGDERVDRPVCERIIPSVRRSETRGRKEGAGRTAERDPHRVEPEPRHLDKVRLVVEGGPVRLEPALEDVGAEPLDAGPFRVERRAAELCEREGLERRLDGRTTRRKRDAQEPSLSAPSTVNSYVS